MFKKIFLMAVILNFPTGSATEWHEIQNLLTQKDYDEAVRLLQGADQSSYNYNLYSGLVAEYKHDYIEAAIFYEKALSLEKNEWLYFHLSRVLINQEMLKEAKSYLVIGLQKFPQSNIIKEQIKRIELLENETYQKEYEEIKKKFETAKYQDVVDSTEKLRKDDFYKRILRFYSLLNLKKYNIARSELKNLKEEHKNEASVEHAEFELDLKSGKYKDAKNAINLLQQEKNDKYEDHYRLALAYYQDSQYTKARAELHQCLKINPNDNSAHDLMAAINLSQEKYTSAILNYKRSLLLNSNRPEAFLNLDEAYEKAPGVKGKTSNLRNAAKRFPHDIGILNRLAYRLEVRGHYQEAKENYEMVLVLKSNDSFAIAGLNRVAKLMANQIFVQYSYDEALVKDTFPFANDREKTEVNSYLATASTHFNDQYTLSANYTREDHKKIATVGEKINTNLFNLNLIYNKRELFASVSGGFINYKSHDSAQVYDKGIVGSGLLSYQLGSHNLATSFSKNYYVQDTGIGFSMEPLRSYLLQDQIELWSNWTLLARHIIGVGNQYKYGFSSIAPTYNVQSIKGLSIRSELDWIDQDIGEDSGQVSLSGNWDHSWTDELTTGFELGITHRGIDDKFSLETKLNSTYEWNSKFQSVQGINFSKYFVDNVEENYGFNVGLRTIF